MRRIQVANSRLGDTAVIRKADLRKLLAVAREADKACKDLVIVPMALAVAVDKLNAKVKS